MDIKYLRGKHIINDTVLYINRGIVNSIIPLRFRSRPEGLSKESKKKIKEQELEELEIIVDDIFEMDDEEDLNKYLN